MPHQSEQKKSTHLIFDGEKIIISEDIIPVMSFLMEIEKEVNSLLKFQEKLDRIRIHYLETIKLIQLLVKKLKDANIDFEYKPKEPMESISEKLAFDLPIRSQIIVLFASLEVLYFLDIAYNQEIDNEDKMRNSARDEKTMKKFINSLVLTEENEYYKKNKARLSKINSKSLRKLRNALTHFFSLSSEGLSIAPGFLDGKARKLENVLKQNKYGNVVFISPEDLYELIKSAHILRIKMWNDSSHNNNKEFKRKMQFVINLVKKHGVVAIYDINLKI